MTNYEKLEMIHHNIQEAIASGEIIGGNWAHENLLNAQKLVEEIRELIDPNKYLGDNEKYRKGHADGQQEVISYVNNFGQ